MRCSSLRIQECRSFLGSWRSKKWNVPRWRRLLQFRGKLFGQLLYSRDILVGNDEYDDRGWYNNLSAREKLFYVSLEALCIL